LSAYLIVDVAEVLDENAYASYRDQVAPGLERAGGRYLVRGGETHVLEGSWRPNRLVVVEFPDADGARAWWQSAAYADLKGLRGRTTRTHMVLVEGLAPESTT
jgi:uncharacterized protein (DUF1330 family)